MGRRCVPLSPFGVLLEPARPNEDIRDIGREELRALVQREHLVVLRGYRTFETADRFSAFCGHLGEISVWPFGSVLELVERRNPADHVFEPNYVSLHWDGIYRPQVPELQVFHCVTAPGEGEGGRTTFSNTALAARRATPRTRELWARVTGVYHRTNSRAVAPILTKHPVRGFPILRYCEPPREEGESFANYSFEFRGVSGSEAAEFHRSLRGALYAPENFYAHAWQTGDVLISDNYTLLHGREAFTSGSPRHLRRVHLLGAPPLENPYLS